MPIPAVSPLPDAHQPTEPELSAVADRRWSAFWGYTAGGWLLILITTVGVGALLTGPLVHTSLMRWDRRVPIDLESARTKTGEMWSQYGGLLGDTLTVVSVALLVGIVLLATRRWASALLLATAMLAEVSVFMLTTIVVPRDRPEVQQLDVSPPTSAFPSGHTAAATALWLSIAVLVAWNFRNTVARVSAWGVALLIGPIVGISRIYRGMHHPLDVVMGLAVGVACVVVAYLAVRAWVGDGRGAEEDGQESTDRASTSQEVGR